MYMKLKGSASKHLIWVGVVLLSVMLVVPLSAAERFKDNGNGTITDAYTGLTWIRDPNVVPSIIGQMEWQKALDACSELVYAGAGPEAWRLPHIEELKSLINTKYKNPQIDINYFVAESSQYWSQTPYNPGSRAWTVNFKNGALGAYDKYNPDKPARLNVRCVTVR